MKNLRNVAYNIIFEVMYNKSYSNLLLKSRMDELSDIDKALTSKIVYGTIQNYDLLKYQLTQVTYQKLSRKQEVLLLMSLYQKHFLTKIPDYALVDETLKLSRIILGNYDTKFLSALLQKLIKLKLIYACTDDVYYNYSINYSHPLWFIKMIAKQHSLEVLKKILDENQNESKIHLRYNLLSNKKDLLEKDQLISHFGTLENSYLYSGVNIGAYHLYIDGVVSVQDYSSQAVISLMMPRPGSKVLDMCAAPGTKTCQMAEFMNNNGSITAYDLYENKINLINEQASRLGIDIIKAKLHDSTKLNNVENKESYDYVLCDALCTGLGVIKRKPEIKYQDISNSMDEIIKVQEQLLENAYDMLKVGGTLVYSTCTINKKENEIQIANFQIKYPDMSLEVERTIMNYEFQSDGFYMAKLVKNNNKAK